MLTRSLASFAMLVALAACGATKPQIATTGKTSAAAVASHKSYFLLIVETPPHGYLPAKRSQQVLEMAKPKIDAELTKKGYASVASENEAELVVRVAAGVKQVVDQPTGSAQLAGVDSEVEELSTLAINIVDRTTGDSLFAGSAKKEIHSKSVKDSDVAAAVTGILAPVPASGSN